MENLLGKSVAELGKKMVRQGRIKETPKRETSPRKVK
jgi:hypothetical protein